MSQYLYIDGATARTEVLAVLNNGHAITHGPNLVVRVAEFDEAANSGAVNAWVVAGHRGGAVKSIVSMMRLSAVSVPGDP